MNYKHFFAALFIPFIFCLFSVFSPVHAAEFLQGDTIVVSHDKIISSTLIAGGQSIHIEGEVKGDVFCGGNEIVITGIVDGDVICGGKTIIVEGQVGGDVRAAGEIIDISGSVKGNTTVIAKTITIQETASVSGEMVSADDSLRMRGLVGKSVTNWGNTAEIEGSVVGNADLHVDTVQIGKNASIAGVLVYGSGTTTSIDQHATIQSKTVRTETETKKYTSSNSTDAWNGGFYIVISLLFGGILLFFMKEKTINYLNGIERKWLILLGWGVVSGILIPVILILFALTLIGIPLSLLGLMLFILVYFMGRALTAVFIGRLIVQKFFQKQKQGDMTGWWLVSGILITWVLFSIPFIGSIFSFIAGIFGIGASITFLLGKYYAD